MQTRMSTLQTASLLTSVHVQHVSHCPSRESWPCRLQGGPAPCHVTCSGPGPAAAPQMCPQRGLPAARPAPLGWDCRSCGGETFGSGCPRPPHCPCNRRPQAPPSTLYRRTVSLANTALLPITLRIISKPFPSLWPLPTTANHISCPCPSLTGHGRSFPELAWSYLRTFAFAIPSAQTLI